MTEMINWTIPTKYWELLNPRMIYRYQQAENNKDFDKLSVPTSVIEQIKIILSNTVDAGRVDISEIEKYNLSWVKEGKIPVSKTNEWDTKYFREVSKDNTVLVLNNGIRPLLNPEATFKIKVSDVFIYTGDNNASYYWLVALEVIDTADNLTLLKLSLG